jgi:hypothetical protein
MDLGKRGLRNVGREVYYYVQVQATSREEKREGYGKIKGQGGYLVSVWPNGLITVRSTNSPCPLSSCASPSWWTST